MFTNQFRILSICVVLFITISSLKSQTTYFPDETVWAVGGSTFGNIFNQAYQIICGDTMINNVNYKKLYLANNTSINSYRPIREDGQKVYQYNTTGDELLYDFSLVLGDTFSTISKNLIVESVVLDTVEGIERKRN